MLKETSLPRQFWRKWGLAEHKLKQRTRRRPYNCQVTCSRPKKLCGFRKHMNNLELGILGEGFLRDGTWLRPSRLAGLCVDQVEDGNVRLQSRTSDRGSLTLVNSHHKKHLNTTKAPFHLLNPWDVCTGFRRLRLWWRGPGAMDVVIKSKSIPKRINGLMGIEWQ